MSQITSGVRSILSMPSFYTLMQKIIGGDKFRKVFVNEYMKISSGDRILDIGCGTSEIIEYFPDDIEYVGFDASEDYIKTAKKKYKNSKRQFFAKLVTDSDIGNFKLFDIAIAIGVLHHLEDDEAIHLFSLAKKFLKKGGRLITIDLCYVENQRKLSKFIISRDRGQNGRTPGGYQKLAKSIFPNTNVFVHDDLLNIPFDHTVLVCKI